MGGLVAARRKAVRISIKRPYKPIKAINASPFSERPMAMREWKRHERKERKTLEFLEPGRLKLQAEFERFRINQGEEAALEHIKLIKKQEARTKRVQHVLERAT